MNKKQLIVVWVKRYKLRIFFRRLSVLLLAVIVGILLGRLFTRKDWINILSALLTPVIAITGVAIVILQWKINQKRLQHELFERRIKLYEIITTFIANIISYGNVENNAEVQFLRETKHAKFIFGSDIAVFIDEIYKKSIDLKLFALRGQQLTGAALENAIQKENQIFTWFQTELNNIQNRFEKYLQL